MSFTTHVVKTGSLTLTRGNLDPTLNLNNYDGFFYYLSGAGGNGYNQSIGFTVQPTGGAGGFVNSNYINLLAPYNVTSLTLQVNLGSFTSLSISYSNDPTSGAFPYVIIADNASSPPGKYGSNNAYPIGYYYGGALIYDINQKFITQRSDSILNSGSVGQEGSINSNIFSTTGGYYGGAGYYGGSYIGSGPTGPFGYSTGGYMNSNTVDGNNGKSGYAVITLIPISTVSSIDFYTSNTSITSPSGSNLMLCSLLGGGGGGGFSHSDSSSIYNYGSGGGGSGSYQLGLYSLSGSTGININIGSGGASGYTPNSGDQTGGGAGGNTTLNFDSTTFTALGGDGGDADYENNASGGAGYFGAGSGMGGISSDIPAGGYSFINIPNNISTINDRGTFNPYYATPTSPNTNYAGNGKGYINTNFGQGGLGAASTASTGSGGGGGPYGANGASGENSSNATGALGYGCGGGGGCHQGGSDYLASAGTAGYAIVSFLPSNNNYKFYTVNSTTPSLTFNYMDFINFKGFWYFLQGENYLPELNMGHFLIQDDGVQNINLSFSTSLYGTITVKFNSLNLSGNIVTQTFTLSASIGNSISVSSPSFASILFYK